MRMFLPQRWSTDGLPVLSRIVIVAILVHYQPSYTPTMKPSDLLQLVDVTLHWGMYPEGKVDISQHIAIPGFPQIDHTVSMPNTDTGSLCHSTLWLRWDNQFHRKIYCGPPWVPDHFNVAIINFLKAIWEILAYHGAHCNDCKEVSNDSTLFHFLELRRRQLLIQLKRAGICL